MRTTSRRRGDVAGFVALLTLIALVGCDDQPVSSASPPPTRAELLGATVSGPLSETVTLTDGRYDGPPEQEGAASHPSLVLLPSSVLYGEIDGVPPQDAAALLVAGTGGSGSFTYLAVFANHSGKTQSIAAVLVGDRIELTRSWLERDRIHLEVVEPAPGDPACCPTQLTRKVYGWQDGGLVLLESTPVGTVSTAEEAT